MRVIKPIIAVAPISEYAHKKHPSTYKLFKHPQYIVHSPTHVLLNIVNNQLGLKILHMADTSMKVRSFKNKRYNYVIYVDEHKFSIISRLY